MRFPPPHYTREILLLALAVAAVGIPLITFVWADPYAKRRAAVAFVFAAVLLAAVLVPYLLQAIWCQVRRARTYPRLLEVKADIEDLMARERGRQALRLHPPLFTGMRFYVEAGVIMFALDVGAASAFSKGDTLLIIHTLKRKWVGTATVADVAAGRLDARLGEADPVFEGFVRQQLQKNEHDIPDVAAVTQADVDARDQAVEEFLEEVMEWPNG